MSILSKKKISGLFFGKTKTEKAEELLQLTIKYIPQIKALMRNANDSMDSSGKIVGRMYDFYDAMGNNGDGMFTGPMGSPQLIIGGSSGDTDGDEILWSDNPAQDIEKAKQLAPAKIAAKPVDVMHELEMAPTPIKLVNLDEIIATLKDKSLLANQRYVREQIDGLCKRLENRKKYHEEVAYYSQFFNTSDEKIDQLLKKYKLVMKTSDLFVPTFPKEAIDIMKQYTEKTLALTGEKPVFYVIGEEQDFEEKFKKLDPILLVQSPFGFWWQVLGAWDKEMLLLSEL